MEAGGTPVEFAIPSSEQNAPEEYEGVPVVQAEDQTVFALVYTDAEGETKIATMEESASESSNESSETV